MQTAEELQRIIERLNAENNKIMSAKEDAEMRAVTFETDLASLLQDTDAEFVKLSSEVEGWKRMANQGKIMLEGMQTKVDSLEKERDEMNMQRSADTKKIESLKSKLDVSERSREEDMQGLSRIGEMEDEMERWKHKANREKVRMEGMQVKMNGLEKERKKMKFQHKKDIKDMESVEERCKILEEENRKLKKLLKKYDHNGYHRSGSRNDRSEGKDKTRNNEDALLNDTSSHKGGKIPSRHSSKSLDSFMDAVLDVVSSKPQSPSTPIRSRRCSNEERPSTPNSSSQATDVPSSWHGGKTKGVFMVPTKGCSPKDLPQAAASPASWHGGKKKNIVMVPTKGSSPNDSPLSNTATPPTSSHSKKSILKVPIGITDLPIESSDDVSTNCAFTARSSVSTLQTLDEMEALIGSIMARENDGIDRSSRSGNDVDRSSKSGPF
jgi:hypothetical protein